jgi:hypothetical protein
MPRFDHSLFPCTATHEINEYRFEVKRFWKEVDAGTHQECDLDSLLLLIGQDPAKDLYFHHAAVPFPEIKIEPNAASDHAHAGTRRLQIHTVTFRKATVAAPPRRTIQEMVAEYNRTADVKIYDVDNVPAGGPDNEMERHITFQTLDYGDLMGAAGTWSQWFHEAMWISANRSISQPHPVFGLVPSPGHPANRDNKGKGSGAPGLSSGTELCNISKSALAASWLLLCASSLGWLQHSYAGGWYPSKGWRFVFEGETKHSAPLKAFGSELGL